MSDLLDAADELRKEQKEQGTGRHRCALCGQIIKQPPLGWRGRFWHPTCARRYAGDAPFTKVVQIGDDEGDPDQRNDIFGNPRMP